MANHCWNFAEFVGTSDMLKRMCLYLQKAREEYLKIDESERVSHLDDNQVWLWAGNYSKVLNVRNELKQVGFDVYQSYGSKWFDCVWEINYLDDTKKEIDTVSLQGSSAWSPVLPFFIKLCKKYGLSAEGDYEEPGMDFAGTFKINNKGELTEEQLTYREYMRKYQFDAFWEQVIYEIEEGYFTSLEDVYKEFENCEEPLSESDKTILRETYEKSQLQD